MNDARLEAFAAPHFAEYEPHAAGAAVTGATVMGQVDAVAQSSVQQQLAAARQKAIAIDSNLMTCHYLIPEDFGVPRRRLVQLTRRRRASGMLSKPSVLDLTHPPPSFGSRNADFAVYHHNQAKRAKQSGERVLRPRLPSSAAICCSVRLDRSSAQGPKSDCDQVRSNLPKRYR